MKILLTLLTVSLILIPGFADSARHATVTVMTELVEVLTAEAEPESETTAEPADIG